MTLGSSKTKETAIYSAWSPTEMFVPRRFLHNGHLQTIAGNYLPRHCQLPEAEACLIEVAPGRVSSSGVALPASHVLCHCHWQPQASERPTVILVHGLEGSSRSQYMIGNGARAWQAGYNVVRMNMRNCGGTDHLSPTLYHSGLSADVDAVMKTLAEQRGLKSFALVGYSMGGNLVLKSAGDYGANAPDYLKAVIGVSPVVDLGVSADALHLPQNRVYEWKFMRGLRARYRRKVELFPAIFSLNGVEQVRTIREFDDKIMAPYSGFEGADDYYFRAASARVVEKISVPALILHALDDPFIRLLPETREKIAGNPHIALIETAHGGHCAFLAPANGYDGYWAERALLDFIKMAFGC
jgi:predicted alpha/beta-fold hydrolase